MRSIRKIILVMQHDPRTRDAPVHLFERLAENDFQILVSTMLSARTKDSTSIPILRKLFRKVRTPEDVLRMQRGVLEHSLYGIGFYHTKTRHLISLSRKLVSDYDSSVPSSLNELLSLPGVGRKTANIVLARAFGKNTIGVDVHVHRISNRLGLVRTKTPEETEKKLNGIVPEKLKRSFNRTLVAYGQMVCVPRNPKCKTCKLDAICPKRRV